MRTFYIIDTSLQVSYLTNPIVQRLCHAEVHGRTLVEHGQTPEGHGQMLEGLGQMPEGLDMGLEPRWVTKMEAGMERRQVIPYPQFHIC